MKEIRLIFSILLLSSNLFFAEDFIRNLPDKEYTNQLKAKDYPNSDAVIILKEQSLQVQETSFSYYGETFHGPTTSYSKILIVKLFNDRAVERYGSFEYEYPEFFGDEFPNGFTIRARVMKEDGSINILPENEIQRIISSKNKNGEPIGRNVLFKFPNVVPGDVIQIEYQFDEVFSFSSSGIYYYNDKDYVIYSNFYLTLPNKVDFRFYNHPANIISSPQIMQFSKSYGSGKTYFWKVQNLDPIPEEPYSVPFEEKSFYTAFLSYDDIKDGEEKKRWNKLAHNFYNNFIDKGSISNKQIEFLGFRKLKDTDSVNFPLINKLYSAIRRNFSLKSFNSIYPFTDDLDEMFELKSGNASDLSIVLYKILQKWDQKVNIVWIRDRREGAFDKNIPTTRWFDRLGVLVNIKGEEKIYDFDKCISNDYKIPWFLNEVSVLVIDEDSCYEKVIALPNTFENNYISEKHKLKFKSIYEAKDSLLLEYYGSKAETFRGKSYGSEEYEVKEDLKERFSGSFSNIDSISINNFQEADKVEINLSGTPLVKPELVDSFIVFRLNSSLISQFKDEIFTNSRKSDFNFESPFCLKIQWEIELPDGFKLKESFPNKSLNCPAKANTEINFKRNGNKIELNAEIRFNQRTIPSGNYNDLINLLDRTLKIIEKDIVLKKI